MRLIQFFSKKITIVCIFLVVGVLLIKTILASQQSEKATTIWQFQSIDTMKYSRDASNDPGTLQIIPLQVKHVADLGATTIAIDTPYDEEFYPVLKAWVSEARKYGLHVWFRGNFSGWEGWFNYAKFTDPSVHHQMTMEFITKHADLFEDGDVFSPLSEPENGVIGDPRGSDVKSAEYNQFLVTSYANCVAAFKKIGKHVSCGYFSMNGDIAKDVLTPQTVAQTGNVVVIDHYVSSSDQMTRDLDFLHAKFPQAHIVLGEFGAPIEDINGNMTDDEQAQFIQSLLTVFYEKRNEISGINYWVVSGGSTALFNLDNTPKKAAVTVTSFYKPFIIHGNVVDELGSPITDASVVTTDGTYSVHTDNTGEYQLALMSGKPTTISVTDSGYSSSSITVTGMAGQHSEKNIVLMHIQRSLIQNIILFFHKILSR